MYYCLYYFYARQMQYVVGVQLYKLFENTEKMYFVTIVIARDFLTYEVNFDCTELRKDVN